MAAPLEVMQWGLVSDLETAGHTVFEQWVRREAWGSDERGEARVAEADEDDGAVKRSTAWRERA